MSKLSVSNTQTVGHIEQSSQEARPTTWRTLMACPWFLILRLSVSMKTQKSPQIRATQEKYLSMSYPYSQEAHLVQESQEKT